MNRITALICFLIYTCIFSGCYKETVSSTTSLQSNSEYDISGYKIYTVQKGAHASVSTTKIVAFPDTILRFTAIFDSTAIYTAALATNQTDIHKLYGFSDCGVHHQQQSARFGWNWRTNALRIYAYVYHNGQRLIKEITHVPLNQENEYQIHISKEGYIFTVNGTHATRIPGACTGSSSRYRLYPYFGGDETAPHTIYIRIKDLAPVSNTLR